jgi:hypothetical protein
MDGNSIRTYRGFVYPLIVVLVFASGYLLGRRLNPTKQAELRERAPASSLEPSMTASTGSAGGLSMAPSIPGLIDPGDFGIPVASEADVEDIHQREMTNQELAMLDRQTMLELAQSLMDGGVPDRDIKGMVDGIAVSGTERERRREGVPHETSTPVERSHEDLVEELKASLRKASVSEKDVEAMVASLRLQQENPVRPDQLDPDILPPPVP